MKITKYEHACLDILESGERLVIDPGVFTKNLTDFSNTSIVVITHVHADHFEPKILQKIIQLNPSVKIFTTQEAADQLDSLNTVVPELGKMYEAGKFKLEFFGGSHAVIDTKTPVAQNVGVLVNETLYYPGDSHTQCSKTFKVLAAPSSAPWYKASEGMELIEKSNCKTIFPTHNALLTDSGNQVINPWLKKAAERSGKKFAYLKPGEYLEI